MVTSFAFLTCMLRDFVRRCGDGSDGSGGVFNNVGDILKLGRKE